MLSTKTKISKNLNFSINILILFYFLSLIYFVLFGKSQQIAPCFSSLVITILIRLFLKNLSYYFSPILIFIIVIYTLFSSYLGSCFNFYGLINHYDDLMHFLSGVLSTLFAYDLFFILISNNFINRFFVISFVFCFSLAVGGFWEIAEFSIDNIFGTNMQIGGLIDTMTDMIDSLIASIITIIICELINKKKMNKPH